jgi:hypothetical protein
VRRLGTAIQTDDGLGPSARRTHKRQQPNKHNKADLFDIHHIRSDPRLKKGLMAGLPAIKPLVSELPGGCPPSALGQADYCASTL